MKRALSLILSLIMILSLFTAIPFSAAETDIAEVGAEADLVESGDESGTCGEESSWYFESDTGKMVIMGSGGAGGYNFRHLKDKIKKVVIGDSITYIAQNSFSDAANLTELVLGKSVTVIEHEAFANTNLEELVIPDSMIYIYREAFYNCKNLTKVTFGNKELRRIYDRAFEYCDLREVVFPDSVVSIGLAAFSNNENLKNVTFGKGLERIDYAAFAGCPIKEVTIPPNVEQIDSYAFGSSRNLVSGFTVIGQSGSAAETLAAGYECKFVPRTYYTVTFSPGDGAGIMDGVYAAKNSYYTLPESTFFEPNSNYEFSHWNVDGINRRAGETIKVTKNLEVIAVWQLTKYVKVTFSANGGSGTMEPREARRGYGYYLPNCEFTPPEGKRFDCWKVGEEYFKPSKSVTADSAITAVAQWVDAPDTISWIDLYLDKEPCADSLPSLGVEAPCGSGYDVAYDYNKQYFTDGVKWEGFLNGNNWTRIDPETTRFIEGKQYRITVLVEAHEGYEFDTDDLTAELNDYSAALSNVYTTTARVSYTFVCGPSDLEAIPKIEVSVNFPKAGDSFSSKPGVFIPTTEPYEVDDSYGVQWRGESDNGAFIAGETYTMIMYIITDNGFYFDPYEDVIISVNGDEKKKDITSSQKFRTQIMYSFICEGEEEAPLLGDVDGDGEVTILDTTFIQRKLASLPVESYNEAAADTDGDGEVTIFDATYIQRYLAGLYCPEGIGKPIA